MNATPKKSVIMSSTAEKPFCDVFIVIDSYF